MIHTPTRCVSEVNANRRENEMWPWRDWIDLDIPADLLDQVDELCADTGESREAWIEKALREQMDRDKLKQRNGGDPRSSTSYPSRPGEHDA